MADLRELYQQVILDHNKRPRNFGRLEQPTHHAQGFNPLCGDKLDLDLRVKDNTIEDICFKGSGCAISTASASVMTETVKGKTAEDAAQLYDRFHRLVTDKPEQTVSSGDLGKLDVFAGVREFPVRVKCATLAWHTLKAALEKKAETISTE